LVECVMASFYGLLSVCEKRINFKQADLELVVKMFDRIVLSVVKSLKFIVLRCYFFYLLC
jgi:hypothetical protein